MEAERKKIFLVDDNITNLTVGKNALIGLYNVLTIPSGEKMLNMLEKITPDLILLDVEMPGMNGYEAIKIIKDREETANIPVIFLTAKSDGESELEGLSLGAVDYITKPFSPPLLLKRIELHLLVEQQKAELLEQKKELQNYNDNLQEMVREKTKTIVELQNAVLKTVAELVECRDDITGGHIERTQQYLSVLVDAVSERSEYQEEAGSWDRDFLLQSAMLHDVGKIAIRDSVLLKPDKLTDEEYEEMKKHVSFGVEVIEKIQKNTSANEFLENAKIFVGAHHEKWDGTGYPGGLSGGGIPLLGRLMAIVDVYDALTNERPYKKAFSHSDAVNVIKNSSGSHFDPQLVDIFIACENEIKNATVIINRSEESLPNEE